MNKIVGSAVVMVRSNWDKTTWTVLNVKDGLERRACGVCVCDIEYDAVGIMTLLGPSLGLFLARYRKSVVVPGKFQH